MICPKCGQKNIAGPTCPQCGVIFARLRERPPAPEVPLRVEEEEPPALGFWAGRFFLLALAGTTIVLGARYLRRVTFPDEGRPVVSEERPRPPAPALDRHPAPPPPPNLTQAPAPPAPLPSAQTDGLTREEMDRANELTSRLNSGQRVGEPDLKSAEELQARHAADPGLKRLLAAVLFATAAGEKAEGRVDAALGHLRRAAVLGPPDSTRAQVAMLAILLAKSDWPAAEAMAREALSRNAREGDALEGLAYALYRQDRNREALETVRAALEVRTTASARDLLEHIQKDLKDEQGMKEQRLAHFNVRYDGDSHEEVGREILRALEHHFATLTSSLEQQPVNAIPVILYTREKYEATGSGPSWSGGAFDQLDGRIRIPIGGLTTSLDPSLDSVLLHELTHAFIHERSNGHAPREIHEGLAQWMEGKRCADLLRPEHMQALADGRIHGVLGFYLEALSFVEYLQAMRGQGGLNELLRLMGESGNVDDAFRQVYGHDTQGTEQAWAERMRQQYGS